MREIKTHRSGLPADANERIMIEPADDADANGVNRKYQLYAKGPSGWEKLARVEFTANGEVPDGATNEALLAVMIDRLEAFQGRHRSILTETACKENEYALRHLSEALHWLMARTRDLAERGLLVGGKT